MRRSSSFCFLSSSVNGLTWISSCISQIFRGYTPQNEPLLWTPRIDHVHSSQRENWQGLYFWKFCRTLHIWCSNHGPRQSPTLDRSGWSSLKHDLRTLASKSAPEGPATPALPVNALKASASSSSSSTSIACTLLLPDEADTELRSGTGLPSFSRIWSIAGWRPRLEVALTAPRARKTHIEIWLVEWTSSN